MNLSCRILVVGPQKLQTKHFIIGIISFFSFLVFSPLTATAGIIFSSDYEDGTFGDAAVRTREPGAGYPSLCCTHSAQVVTSQARSGNRAVKFELRSTDTGYQYGTYTDPYVRAELERYGVAQVGDKRWYGFSIYIDPSSVDTTNDPNGTMLMQWHTNTDACDQSKSAHLSIHATKDGRWKVRNISDGHACTVSTPSDKRTFTVKSWDLGVLQKGVWVDWVVYANWSYSSPGELKVWKDGKLVIERNGPNTYNDQNKEYIKWGIYKSWWQIVRPATDTLIVYHDTIRIGDANSSYDEVTPSSYSSVLRPPTNLGIQNIAPK